MNNKYNSNNHEFNFHDCSFSFIAKIYSLVDIFKLAVNSLFPDDSELYT